MKMLRGVSKGLPQTGMQGGAGVGVFYLHRLLASKIDFLQKHPLAAPIGMILGGHILKKSGKLSSLGAALVGAGGYAGAQVFEVQKSLKAQAPTAQTSGFEDDTGALTSPGDVGMLLDGSNTGDIEETSPAYDDAYTL